MGDNQRTKEAIQESLEKNFIDNKKVVEKEMNMLNILISSFCEFEYTYDEYCKKRMEYELEACDKALDIDTEEEISVSEVEKRTIQGRAVKRVMENPGTDYEDAFKEEYIQWQIGKCYKIDQKMYYQISKYSSIKLLENKLPEELWKNKKPYFENICEEKAKRYGTACAEANKSKHEEDIRSSMI